MQFSSSCAPLMSFSPDGTLVDLEARVESDYASIPRRTVNDNFNSPSATQFGGARHPSMGRTPNPYADRTPGWVPSRTPNPYAEGGKTPAWSVSSRTPNPYADGARTPAWNVGSRTPNPNAPGAGGSAPAGSASTGWGGATPGRSWTASASGGGWGNTSPKAQPDAWGAPRWGNPPLVRFQDQP